MKYLREVSVRSNFGSSSHLCFHSPTLSLWTRAAGPPMGPNGSGWAWLAGSGCTALPCFSMRSSLDISQSFNPHAAVCQTGCRTLLVLPPIAQPNPAVCNTGCKTLLRHCKVSPQANCLKVFCCTRMALTKQTPILTGAIPVICAVSS